MKRQILLFAAVILGALALIALSASLFVVRETEQVIITQFGKPVGKPITTPGLKMKVPFVQQVHAFEKRFLEWDGDPNQVPTKDKRFIWVDSYARWRITDPLLFFQRLRDERGAQSRLDDILDGETRNTVAKHQLIELVRMSDRAFVAAEEVGSEVEPDDVARIEYGREKLREEVLASTTRRTKDLGIEILDFRFKRINYVEEVRQEVYSRMISERKRIAEQYRSEGAGEAARIAGERERELRVITSEAYRLSQEIVGRAEAEATNIYASSYNRDSDFYRFLKTMETLKTTLDENTTMLLSTDGDLLRYLGNAR
ncbi:MAG TPA: protease modulator HflC [Thermoanaerobaculia bacterium]|nr:protease modulator HflC [Thermoanaerobaculia bacterium]